MILKIQIAQSDEILQIYASDCTCTTCRCVGYESLRVMSVPFFSLQNAMLLFHVEYAVLCTVLSNVNGRAGSRILFFGKAPMIAVKISWFYLDPCPSFKTANLFLSDCLWYLLAWFNRTNKVACLNLSNLSGSLFYLTTTPGLLFFTHLMKRKLPVPVQRSFSIFTHKK